MICDPVRHDALELGIDGGHNREILVNPETGQRFPVRDGIPILPPSDELSGPNKRYQAMYDRSAPFCDLSTWLYSPALVMGTAEQLPFRDAMFDAVFYFGGDLYCPSFRKPKQ